MATTKVQSELIVDDVALAGNPTTSTQGAGNNTTRIATTAFVTTAVDNLIASAPGTMDTLNEIAAALGDDPSFTTTVNNAIATKAPLASPTFTTTITTPDINITGGSQIGQDYAYLKSNSTSTASLTLRKDSTGADSIDFLQLRSNGNGLIGKIEGDGDISFKDATFSGTLAVAGDANFDSGTLFVDVSANKVGVGTTDPAGKFHVAGHTSSVASIFESSGSGDTVPVQLKVKANNGTTSTQGLYGNAGSASTDNTITLGTSGTSGLTVTNGGNVGIGDTDPQDFLEVRSTSLGGITISNSNHNQAALSFARSAAATARIFTTEPGATHTSAMHFQTGIASGPALVTAMTIDENQNVGIGTTDPSQQLTVSGGSGASTLVQFGEAYDTSLYIKATNTASAMLRFQNASDVVKYSMGYRNDNNVGPFRIRAAATLDSGGHKWDFDAAGTFHVIPNNTAALVNIIASGTGNDSTIVMSTAQNGRGIYVDDSDTNKMKFYTGYGKGAANREIFMNNDGDLAIGATRKFYVDGEGDTYMHEYSANEFAIVTGNSRKFALSGGNLYHTGSINSNHNFSDERLKENIVVIPNALEKVNSLRGITFTRKDDGSVGTGLIAQELEKVLPEAVYDSKKIDSLENPDAEEYKAINYGNTVGLLVEAIKELEARVKNLEG